ncbi:MAG TPA: T9SS type A sorting domain-containing protein [Bacteroidia bacterium]|nr:T9SS type A sorting domain-containing protein [Bacteroidia bacterium]
MKFRLTLLSVIFTSISLFCFAQEQPRLKTFSIPKGLTVDFRQSASQFNPILEFRVLPKPDEGADEATIEKVQKELAKYRLRRNTGSSNQRSQATADSLVMLRNFSGNLFNGYVPNDNDMAISNGDIVCSVSNTTIHSKDQYANQVHGSFALHNITSGLGLAQEEFDPKVLYDPVSNRFIMVCLNGFTDSTSNVIVGFSQDTTSFGNWNFYALPGNPLNNSLWTDFPMLAVNDSNLFITVNLLYNDSTWQAGFNESLIWKINKSEGYSGVTLNPVLYSNIHHNGEPIRNLCPVRGGSGLYGPDFFFLSNRNFAASGDTVFLVTLPPGPSALPSVQPVVTNVGYHMPLDADQPFTDKLAVNDARFLGAYYENGMIQGVASSLDTVSGYDGIFHIRMDNLSGPPFALSYIYTEALLDLAYPNIAYAGTSPFSHASVISLLKSNSTTFPGCGAVYYDFNGDYSAVKSVKEGQGYTNMLAGIERWGDYTGCQTRYNMPGTVWMNGSYSIVNHQTRTWIAELVPSALASAQELPGSSEEVKVYPNPATEQVTVDFTLNSDDLIVVNLTDGSGKLVSVVYRGHIIKGKNSITIDTSSLSKGVYIMTVINGKGIQIGNKSFVRN